MENSKFYKAIYPQRPFQIKLSNLTEKCDISELREYLMGTFKVAVSKITAVDQSSVVIDVIDKEVYRMASRLISNGVWKGKRLCAKSLLPQESRKSKLEDERSEDEDQEELTLVEELLALHLPLLRVPLYEQAILTYKDAVLLSEYLHSQICEKNPELAGWAEKTREENGGSLLKIDPPVTFEDYCGYRSCYLFDVGHNADGEAVVGLGLSEAKGRPACTLGIEPGDNFIHLPFSIKLAAKVFQDFIRTTAKSPLGKSFKTTRWQTLRVRTTTCGNMMLVVRLCAVDIAIDALMEIEDMLKKCFTDGLGYRWNVMTLYAHFSGNRNLDKMKLLLGPPSIEETIAGFKFNIGPFTRLELNPKVARNVLDGIAKLADPPPDAVAIILYGSPSGVPFALIKKCARTYVIDTSERMSQEIEEIQVLNSLDNLEISVGRLEDELAALQKILSSKQIIILFGFRRPRVISNKVVALIRAMPNVLRIVGICTERKSGVKCWTELLSAPQGLDKTNGVMHEGNPFVPVRAISVDTAPFTHENTVLVLSERVDPSKYPPPTKPVPAVLPLSTTKAKPKPPQNGPKKDPIGEQTRQNLNLPGEDSPEPMKMKCQRLQKLPTEDSLEPSIDKETQQLILPGIELSEPVGENEGQQLQNFPRKDSLEPLIDKHKRQQQKRPGKESHEPLRGEGQQSQSLPKKDSLESLRRKKEQKQQELPAPEKEPLELVRDKKGQLPQTSQTKSCLELSTEQNSAVKQSSEAMSGKQRQTGTPRQTLQKSPAPRKNLPEAVRQKEPQNLPKKDSLEPLKGKQEQKSPTPGKDPPDAVKENEPRNLPKKDSLEPLRGKHYQKQQKSPARGTEPLEPVRMKEGQLPRNFQRKSCLELTTDKQKQQQNSPGKQSSEAMSGKERQTCKPGQTLQKSPAPGKDPPEAVREKEPRNSPKKGCLKDLRGQQEKKQQKSPAPWTEPLVPVRRKEGQMPQISQKKSCLKLTTDKQKQQQNSPVKQSSEAMSGKERQTGTPRQTLQKSPAPWKDPPVAVRQKEPQNLPKKYSLEPLKSKLKPKSPTNGKDPPEAMREKEPRNLPKKNCLEGLRGQQEKKQQKSPAPGTEPLVPVRRKEVQLPQISQKKSSLELTTDKQKKQQNSLGKQSSEAMSGKERQTCTPRQTLQKSPAPGKDPPEAMRQKEPQNLPKKDSLEHLKCKQEQKSPTPGKDPPEAVKEKEPRNLPKKDSLAPLRGKHDQKRQKSPARGTEPLVPVRMKEGQLPRNFQKKSCRELTTDKQKQQQNSPGKTSSEAMIGKERQQLQNSQKKDCFELSRDKQELQQQQYSRGKESPEAMREKEGQRSENLSKHDSLAPLRDKQNIQLQNSPGKQSPPSISEPLSSRPKQLLKSAEPRPKSLPNLPELHNSRPKPLIRHGKPHSKPPPRLLASLSSRPKAQLKSPEPISKHTGQFFSCPKPFLRHDPHPKLPPSFFESRNNHPRSLSQRGKLFPKPLPEPFLGPPKRPVPPFGSPKQLYGSFEPPVNHPAVSFGRRELIFGGPERRNAEWERLINAKAAYYELRFAVFGERSVDYARDEEFGGLLDTAAMIKGYERGIARLQKLNHQALSSNDSYERQVLYIDRGASPAKRRRRGRSPPYQQTLFDEDIDGAGRDLRYRDSYGGYCNEAEMNCTLFGGASARESRRNQWLKTVQFTDNASRWSIGATSRKIHRGVGRDNRGRRNC